MRKSLCVMKHQETSHHAADQETSHCAADQEISHRAADQETSHRAADQETDQRAADQETSHRAADQETSHRAADQETSQRAADQETSHCAADPPVMETSPRVNTTKYCVRYEGNGSKKWDGKMIWLDGEWLRSLYDHSELVPGNKLSLPWMGKGGRMTYWSVVLVDPSQELSSDKSASAQKRQKGTYLHLAVLVGLQLTGICT